MKIKVGQLLRHLLVVAVRRRLAAGVGVVALLAAVLTGTAVGTASAAPQTVRGAAAAQASTGWVCPGTPIPDGYVVTLRAANGCNGAGAWYIQPVHNGIWVCATSPIPAGYVVTLHTANGCNSNIDTWFLETARDGQWVCAGSPIPSGYVLTGHISNACGNIGSWFQQQARAGQYICPGVAAPAGFRTDVFNASMCSGLGGWLLVSA
ncbi:hypothetical protein ACH4TQ_37815 [Streptomyces sp. NPDC021218]|uniref:hypothetical protein n=1 Tax=Streptomyces sp. NPDC021218 TaxID=3365119 RepID=UPI0037B84093